MREIRDHRVNACNEAITLHSGETDESGATSRYRIAYKRDNGIDQVNLRFHTGPVADGVNGITNEALLAILADRLRGFQGGPFACQENADALAAIETAQARLGDRTRARVARGVEGTSEV